VGGCGKRKRSRILEREGKEEPLSFMRRLKRGDISLRSTNLHLLSIGEGQRRVIEGGEDYPLWGGGERKRCDYLTSIVNNVRRLGGRGGGRVLKKRC